MSRHLSRTVLRLMLIISVVLAPLAVNASPALAATYDMGKPIYFVHGYDLYNTGYDCNSSYWGAALERFRNSGDPANATGTLWTYGYYANDSGCDIKRQFTRDTPIPTIGRDLAWEIYNRYSRYGIAVDVVAHSMGGLIIRSALTGVENDDSSYPPVLLVEDVVTLSTPHRGVQYATVADLFFHGVCPVQCQEMRQGSWFLNTWLNDNPQADNGTRWTLIGLDDDIFVSAASAVPNDLPASHKIIYAGGQYLPKPDAHMELLWRVGWRFYTLRQCDFRTPNCSMNDRSTFVETTGLWDAITMSRYSVWGWNGPDGLGVVNSGSGGGGGGSGTPPPSHTPPSGAAVKRNDYNRDGNSDIVAVYNDYIHIWFGTGSGGFAYGGSIGSGWTPYASTLTAVGDINGDGNGDLVAIYNDYLHTWFGTGSGGFIYGGAIGSGWTPYASTLASPGDINGDGRGDLVAVYNDYIYTWFGTGSGGFATGGPIGSGWTPYASTLTGAGDINGDGRGDLVAVYNDYIHTWFGTSSGGFTYGGPIGSGWTPYANTLTGMGDINRDGKSDLLAISNDYIYTWFGTGSGGFATGGPIGSGWNIYAPIH